MDESDIKSVNKTEMVALQGAMQHMGEPELQHWMRMSSCRTMSTCAASLQSLLDGGTPTAALQVSGQTTYGWQRHYHICKNVSKSHIILRVSLARDPGSSPGRGRLNFLFRLVFRLACFSGTTCVVLSAWTHPSNRNPAAQAHI